LDFELLISKFGLHLATFIVCLISGFVPIVNAEIYLITVSSFSAKTEIFFLIFISTSGQMIAKSILFLSGRGILNIPFHKYEKKIENAKEKFKKWENRSFLFIFLSASSGFPPFYVVSVLSGMLKLNFKWFVISGFLGRFVRFAVAVLFPQLIKGNIL
jgi:membrane protein YqaA with SNARE-associated domain